MNTAVAPLPTPAEVPEPPWTLVALSPDGLGPHAVAWDWLNTSRFGAHPALDSRLWNLLLVQARDVQVVLCRLGSAAEPTAMCLLVHKGAGHWQTFSPAAAPLGPVMIDRVSWVEGLMRDLRPQARRVDLLAVDPGVCALHPQPWQRVSVSPQALVVGAGPAAPAASPAATPAPVLVQTAVPAHGATAAPGAGLRFAFSRAPAERDAALQRYLKLGEAGDGAQPHAMPAALLPALVQAFAGSGQAAFIEAFDGDELVASQLCLLSPGWCVGVHARPAPQAATEAAGLCWQQPMLRWAAANLAPESFAFYGWTGSAGWPQISACRRTRDLAFFAPGNAAAALGWNFTQQPLALGSSPRVVADLQVEQLNGASPWPEDATQMMVAAAAGTPQALSEWFQNLWQTVYAQHPDVHLCLFRQAGVVVAALPVVVERSWAGNTLTFLSNYYTALFVPALAPGLTVDTLARGLRQWLRLYSPLAVVRLEPMDPHADHFHLLQQALERAGLSTHRYYRFGNWYLPTPGSYADFLKGRTAGLRSTIKRMGKRCQELEGRIEVLTEEADLQRGLDAYWKVYRTSWKQDEPFPAFINGLARWCASQGRLRLGILWLQNEPVAAQIWLVHAGRAEIFKVAYDEAHKAVSPGSVLTAALLERVIDRDRVQEVDFLVGDDAYKRTWMSHRRERWGLVAFNPWRIKGAFGLARLLGGRLVRKLRGQRLVSPAQEEAGG